MDKRWRCPSCFFYNEYSTERCISCGQARPTDAEPPETLSLDFESTADSPSTATPSPHITRRPKPSTGPRQTPLPPKKMRSARSTVRWAIVGVVVMIGVIAAVGGIAGRDTSTDVQDGPYLDAFWTLNSERNNAIELSNSRYDEWLQTSTELPGAEFLVATELSDLQSEAELITPPESAELAKLHQDWLESLRRLAEAEELLADEPTQENLEADFEAWQNEDVAYTSLYDYCNDL